MDRELEHKFLPLRAWLFYPDIELLVVQLLISLVVCLVMALCRRFVMIRFICWYGYIIEDVPIICGGLEHQILITRSEKGKATLVSMHPKSVDSPSLMLPHHRHEYFSVHGTLALHPDVQ